MPRVTNVTSVAGGRRPARPRYHGAFPDAILEYRKGGPQCPWKQAMRDGKTGRNCLSGQVALCIPQNSDATAGITRMGRANGMKFSRRSRVGAVESD